MDSGIRIYLSSVVYASGKKTVTSNYHIMHSSLDDMIPFNEYFVIPYLLWFAYVTAAIAYLFFKNKEERFFMDPYEVTPIDTTGCGDNFAASFIHGILKGMSHKECAEFACGAGGLNSQAIGAHMHIHSEEQIRDFMSKTAKRKIDR